MAFGSSVLTHKKEQQIKIAGEFKPTVDCLCAIRRGFVAVYRSLGSIDVVAAARSVLQVERDSEDANIRIVRQIKNSLAPSDGEIRFSITAETGFQWLECRSASIPSAEPEVPEFASKTEKAAYLIKKLLSDGDMSAREIYIRIVSHSIQPVSQGWRMWSTFMSCSTMI